MDKTKNQIREEDLDLFEKRIAPTKKQAVGAIQSFGNLEKTLMQKLNNKISVPGNFLQLVTLLVSFGH